ncbi:hypothetical protein DQ240_16925 [Blastococcus sp. TF02A-26]|nr:hypothetical protein DQ240_16925 [Blastococcus sp. TF02A-26]
MQVAPRSTWCPTGPWGTSSRLRGLVALLDWQPSAHRQADLVEAAVAASWLAGGWQAALETAATLVHPPLGADVDALLGGADPDLAAPACDSAAFRRLAHLGSYVLEAAAAEHLYGAGTHDEGALTARRRPLLAARWLTRGDRADGCRARDTDHRLDHVQARVGLEHLRRGAEPAVEQARSVLGL